MNTLDTIKKISTETNNINEKTIDTIKEIDINKIKTNNLNFYSITEIDSLAENIKFNGLINPLQIKEDYTLLSGHRRLKALQKLGIKKVKVIIVNIANSVDEELFLMSANAYRRLTPEEKKLEIQKLTTLYTQKKETDPKFKNININKVIAKDLGISESTVKRAKIIPKENTDTSNISNTETPKNITPKSDTSNVSNTRTPRKITPPKSDIDKLLTLGKSILASNNYISKSEEEKIEKIKIPLMRIIKTLEK